MWGRVSNPHFYYTLPHILRTPNNYLMFSLFKFILFYFPSIPSLTGMNNDYYCILKWKKILKMKKKKSKILRVRRIWGRLQKM